MRKTELTMEEMSLADATRRVRCVATSPSTSSAICLRASVRKNSKSLMSSSLPTQHTLPSTFTVRDMVWRAMFTATLTSRLPKAWSAKSHKLPNRLHPLTVVLQLPHKMYSMLRVPLPTLSTVEVSRVMLSV